MTSNRGFASVYLLILIPVIIAIGFALYWLFSFSDSNIEMTHSCLREQIKIQEQVKRSLKALLKLNPQAESLRKKYFLAKKQLMLATASMNSAAVTAARTKMNLIWSKRQLLDLQQKNILLAINHHLQVSQSQLQMKMQAEAYKRKRDFHVFVEMSVSDLKFKKVKLAVVPDSREMAPTYSLSHNFLEDQALQMNWRLHVKTQGVSAHFLPVSSFFDQSCSTTINHKEDEWPTVTRKASLSLRRS